MECLFLFVIDDDFLTGGALVRCTGRHRAILLPPSGSGLLSGVETRSTLSDVPGVLSGRLREG